MYGAGAQDSSARYDQQARGSTEPVYSSAEDSGYLDVDDAGRGGPQRQPTARSRAASAQLGMAGNDDFASMMDDILNADKRINDVRLKRLEEQNRLLAERFGGLPAGGGPANTGVQMDDDFDGFGGGGGEGEDGEDEGLYDEPAVNAEAGGMASPSGSQYESDASNDE